DSAPKPMPTERSLGDEICLYHRIGSAGRLFLGLQRRGSKRLERRAHVASAGRCCAVYLRPDADRILLEFWWAVVRLRRRRSATCARFGNDRPGGARPDRDGFGAARSKLG